jgi:hypothetical protein
MVVREVEVQGITQIDKSTVVPIGMKRLGLHAVHRQYSQKAENEAQAGQNLQRCGSLS